MRWITREGARVDRVACPWLIKKFIDKDAEFLFVPANQVLTIAKAQKATSFDARGADFDHKDGKCTFEVLLDEYKLHAEALRKLGKIVHGADIPEDVSVAAESAGLKAFADGMHDICPDDRKKLELSFPLYDALYAFCAKP